MEKTPADDLMIFDLEALKARCLNNLNLVDRVLAKFTTQVDADLAELEQAYTTGNTEGVAKMAHRIKGMSASIEARAMSDSAARCECTALAAGVAELPTLLTHLRNNRDQLLSTIAQIRCSNNQPSPTKCHG